MNDQPNDQSNEQPSGLPSGQPTSPPEFDPSAPHHARPKLRRVRGFPVPVKTKDGKEQTLLGLADAQQISSKMIATLPAVQAVLPQLDGTRTIDEIVQAVGQGLTADFLEKLVAQLDDAALIEGPTFEALAEEMRREFDSSPHLPPGSTAQFAEALVAQKLGQDTTDDQKREQAPQELRAALDAWIDQALADADDPAFERLPAAVIAPHIDYPRGWINYASVWGRMRTTERPDRVLILGTNHFGQATGVCGCDKGYQTPLGVSPIADDLLDALTGELGDDHAAVLMEHRFDHEREHSIELQIPWIQHCLGDADTGEHVPVLGVLVHDPTVNEGDSYDGTGLAYQPFVEAMERALARLGGTTLIVSSADLSHVGPAFGDEQPMTNHENAEAERQRIQQHDRDMLELVATNKPDDLVASMSWQQNPTRWCSVGNMTAAMRLAKPDTIRILNYAGAADEQGTALVTHAALAMS